MTLTVGLAILSVVVSILIGSGGLTFVLAYGRRLARAEYDSSKSLAKAEAHDKELAAVTERVAFMQSTFESIRESLSKLHVIDSIKSSVDLLGARLEDNRKDTAELKADFRDFIKGLPVAPK